ncbi:DUF2752 domain-containing protein [Lacrimispora sp. NSJ-141]|uniref:DUF2752 domain-containing protein n=1 Tax=Lientehia hominis TaxID=2897778 RepID=A0AAP2RL56_9FIRM|nr:DUF2752 domain-containing protein [Lientehia hominis]MCD2493713.1 DUF2752 domain-containing protein [Lientehia hominis]
MTSSIWAMTEKKGGAGSGGKTERTLYLLGLAAILVVAAASFIIRYFHIPLGGPLMACPIYSLTGFFCPGCGGTRAFRLLFQGKITASIICHPLVIYGMAVFGIFMVSHTLRIFTKGKIGGMTYRHIYIKIAVVLLILNVIVKNLAWICWHVNLIEWASAL